MVPVGRYQLKFHLNYRKGLLSVVTTSETLSHLGGLK